MMNPFSASLTLTSYKNDESVFSIMNMDSMSCARCDDGFEPKAKIVNSNGELYHPECFV